MFNHKVITNSSLNYFIQLKSVLNLLDKNR
ncbi:Uncharacterised protein [Yersinia enterocolitica]|nr:Uncharacterised protein [Yersinia enterocolitica]VTP87355.1 Uncharacterised protein [Yersinia enterocolitica subsp. enterocolitica]